MSTARLSPPPIRFEPFSEGSSIRGMEIFASGTHRGKAYNGKDLDNLLLNFADFSSGNAPLLEVPCVIGHEEPDEQRWLERTDLPAAAYVRDLDVGDGGIVKADVDDLADEVERVLRARRFKKVSAEIYDQVPEGIPGTRDEIMEILQRRGIDARAALDEAKQWAPEELARQESQFASGTLKRVEPLDAIVDYRLRSHLGKMLRRVAFLGADVPQVKRLADIPMPQKNSERRRFAGYRPITLKFSSTRARPLAGTYWAFSEVVKMDREAMLAKLAEHGMDTSAVTDETPDETLAEMVRTCEAKDADSKVDDKTPVPASPMDDEPVDDTGAAPMDDGPAPGETPEGDTKDLSEYGEDEELPEPKDDAEKEKFREMARKHGEKSKRMLEKYCGMERHDDTDANPAAASTPEDAKVGKPEAFSEKRIVDIVNRAVEGAVKRLVAPAISKINKFSESAKADTKKTAVAAFCEAQRKAGRITPSELDRGDPANLFDELMRADATTVVSKFKEGGKEVAMTDFDLKKRSIERRKAFAFGEKVKGGGAEHTDSDKDLVEKFSEASGLTKHNPTFIKEWEKFSADDKKRTVAEAKQFFANAG